MTTPRSISIYTILKVLLFGVALYFPVFHFIDDRPIYLWDESLFGLRAIHLLQTGEYMFNFNQFDGLFDHANTKLPFTTWIQVICMKIIGINELGMRLPIGIIFVLMASFIIRYTSKHMGSAWIGVIFTLVLICSPGIVRNHMLRSGDQDMPLLCYMMVAIVSYWHYLRVWDRRYLWLFTIAMIAAFLTKNLLAGVIIPGMLVYTIWTGRLRRILTDRYIWMSIMLIIGSYAAAVLYLEYRHDGFLERMWRYELGGRYTEAKDGHQGSIWYFVKDLALVHFKIYFWMVPIAVLCVLDRRMDNVKKDLILYLSILYMSYLFIISFSSTKLFWYGMPAALPAALILGVAIYHVYDQHLRHWAPWKRYTLVALFSIVVFAIPYSRSIQYVFEPLPTLKEEKYGQFIHRLSIDQPTIRNFTIADNNYLFPPVFWKEKYNMSGKGYSIDSKVTPTFEIGDTIMTCLNNIYLPTIKKYDIEMIQIWDDCYIYVIVNTK